MNDPVEIPSTEPTPEVPELSSVEKFFAKIFGAKSVEVMSAFKGKGSLRGASREPRIMKHSTKSGPGRKHQRGPGVGYDSTRGIEGRLTKHTGACEPVEIKPERKHLYTHSTFKKADRLAR